MIEGYWIKDLLIVLATAGVVVPLFGWLRIGVVPGFLIAGVVLGPGGLGSLAGEAHWLGWITFANPERVRPFAELGVLFLLFLIGLEFSPERLWRMRRFVLGVGSGQVIACAALIVAGATWLSGSLTVGLVIGLALALSSTAIVTQVLMDAHRFGSRVGRLAMGVLIFQDLTVVPIVIVVGLLGGNHVALPAAVARAVALSAAALVVIWLAGRFLAGPLLKLAASTGNRELMVAVALLLAIGTAVVTAAVGLSSALGAFLAGLILGGSAYRHQIEVDIEPFKGLLLGLFFMTIGMNLDIGRLLTDPLPIAVAFAGLIAAKGIGTFAAARIFRIETPVAIDAALLLAGAGEFGFVIFNLAGQDNLIPPEIGDIVVMAAVLSMIATPGLAYFGRLFGDYASERRHAARHGAEDANPTAFADHVVICGFGRVGEAVARVLEAENIDYVGLDLDGDRVAALRREGKPVYFGDASRREILEKVGGAAARAFALTSDKPEATAEMAKAIRGAWPQAAILARALDVEHAEGLRELGVEDVVPEALEGSLQLAGSVLRRLGLPDETVDARLDVARAAEVRRLAE